MSIHPQKQCLTSTLNYLFGRSWPRLLNSTWFSPPGALSAQLASVESETTERERWRHHFHNNKKLKNKEVSDCQSRNLF